MIDKKTNRPFINVWFGNFYRPAFDNEEFVGGAIKKLADMGFNGIQLDSKAWEDFRERYKGGEASQYVKMQEFMMQKCKENGISHNFLALYLCADNLYPNIRFSPPIFGESVTNADGSDGRWYKYWSDKAKDSMIEHCKGLFENYSDNLNSVEINGKLVNPCCSMWDPIIAPSFDEEGRNRYLGWLKDFYGGIEKLNAAYRTSFKDFFDMQKEDYWFSCAYDEPLYTKKELDEKNPKAVMWADNMRWRIYETSEYFKDMQKRLHELKPDIYTMPDIAQWSYFLNIDASQLANVGLADLWDTANRGIDIYKIAPYVDCTNFITVPITPYGDPDAYVSSAQHSMMRAMNRDREFMGGIYWGRFLYNDIYEFLTPCEIVGSMVSNGVKGYTSYGMCGMDDGGLLHRMPEGFNESLKTANEWAAKVIPLIQGKHKSPVAILFPSAMAAYEPMGVDGNKERRYDLLGWYKMCCNGGYGCDIIDTTLICGGVLDDYRVLIIPENDCYFLDDNSEAEKLISKWTEKGGIVIHSPMDKLVENCFGVKGEKHEPDSFMYNEKGLIRSDIFCSYEGEKTASYLSDGKGAVVKNDFGRGKVYSFGFAYGYSYSSKIAPHVPLSEKNNELYPVPLMSRNIFCDILEENGIEHSPIFGKGIETAEFDNCMVVVNHTSNPYEIKADGEKLYQYNIGKDILLPRSAVVIKK